jgi:hypothetical protein
LIAQRYITKHLWKLQIETDGWWMCVHMLGVLMLVQNQCWKCQLHSVSMSNFRLSVYWVNLLCIKLHMISNFHCPPPWKKDRGERKIIWKMRLILLLRNWNDNSTKIYLYPENSNFQLCKSKQQLMKMTSKWMSLSFSIKN